MATMPQMRIPATCTILPHAATRCVVCDQWTVEDVHAVEIEGEAISVYCEWHCPEHNPRGSR